MKECIRQPETLAPIVDRHIGRNLKFSLVVVQLAAVVESLICPPLTKHHRHLECLCDCEVSEARQ